MTETAEYLQTVAPRLQPGWNLAAYADRAPSLQKLVQLGVDLHRLERLPGGVAQRLLACQFERDVQPKLLLLLQDVGLSPDAIGDFITRCPSLVWEELAVLQTRLNYLEYKRFTVPMVCTILGRNPAWLSHSTKSIDQRLGHFQQTFRLSGAETRALAVRQPRLITADMAHVRTSTFAIAEEMGFAGEQAKNLLLACPTLWLRSQRRLVDAFVYLHSDMGLPSQRILEAPQVLLCRPKRLRQRHLFLQQLGRAQYDPQKEHYVSLMQLATGNDATFCSSAARTSVAAFNAFLKTL